MKLRIVFPCMTIDPNLIDPDYTEEHAAVRLLGGIATLFEFDLFKAGNYDEAFKNVPILPELQAWIYRGELLSLEEQHLFYIEMKQRGYVIYILDFTNDSKNIIVRNRVISIGSDNKMPITLFSAIEEYDLIIEEDQQ